MEKRYRIDGVGRIGSYTKAKRGMYSRSRKYWTLFIYSDNCSAIEITSGNGYCCDGGTRHYSLGFVEVAGVPQFKTKKQAVEFFSKSYALEN